MFCTKSRGLSRALNQLKINHMIKKTILLVTAVMIAASSVSHAANKLKVTNESKLDAFYKVGNTVKKIAAGSSKSFSLKGLKKVKITASTSASGNALTGQKRSFGTFTISEAKANPSIATNPVSGQTTPLL
jgi:hypothetical protein